MLSTPSAATVTDNGFALTNSRNFNLLWLNCPIKPALLLSLNRYQKVKEHSFLDQVATLALVTWKLKDTVCSFTIITPVLGDRTRASNAANTQVVF